jgi:putative endonuclease
VTARPERLAARRLGRLAEFACTALLRAKGYQILARDLRTPVGEIDILACRGRVLAVVEVKARAGAAGPDALGPRQRQRLVRAAQAAMLGRPWLKDFQVRFDLMLASPWRWPKHVVDAWRPGD